MADRLSPTVESARQAAKAFSDAARLFKAQPDFVRIQVQMRHRLGEAERKAPVDAQAYGSEARMDYVLKRFDIQARAFLELVTDIHLQDAFVAMLVRMERLAWTDYASRQPDFQRRVRAQRRAFMDKVHTKVRQWIHKGYKRLESLRKAQREPSHAPALTTDEAAPAQAAAVATGSNDENPSAPNWESIEISFLSDVRVQIRNGTDTETHNYRELGFADRRVKRGKPKPNQAWVTLRAMAEQNGIIRDGVKTGAAWPKVEKRMQEIRKVLRKHFKIDADPIPFVQGTGYQARFKIGCGPSFDT